MFILTEADVLPSGTTPELRFSPFHITLDSISQHAGGIVEARYNGSTWGTVCVHVRHAWKVRDLANQACQDVGYPWARTWQLIVPHSRSDSVGRQDEFIMKDAYFPGKKWEVIRWIRGANLCQKFNYSWVAAECEQGNRTVCCTFTLVKGVVCPVWPNLESCFCRCEERKNFAICGLTLCLCVVVSTVHKLHSTCKPLNS